MVLPASFQKDGFLPYSTMRGKVKLPNGQFLKQLLIGTEGMSDEGKTRWAMTAPGVIQMLAIDRNHEAVFDSTGLKGTNPNIAIKVFEIPLLGTATVPDYQKHYANVRDSLYGALANPQSNVVIVDGDSDFWELHILAHFGKNTGIYPQTKYAAPYAEKRAQISRMRDSGKIVICTNKVRDEYINIYKADGTPEKDSGGNDLRKKTGGKVRQGFPDQDYLWDMQIRHLYQPAHTAKIGAKEVSVPGQWGIRIMKCKANMDMAGMELWGDDCSFKGMVENCYPDVPLARWGF